MGRQPPPGDNRRTAITLCARLIQVSDFTRDTYHYGDKLVYEGVDETALTTNALWQAVTGAPGEGWIEEVHVVDRSPAQAQYKVEREAHYAQKRERAAKSKIEPASGKQIDYLRALIAKTGPDRLDAEFADAIAGTAIAPRAETKVPTKPYNA